MHDPQPTASVLKCGVERLRILAGVSWLTLELLAGGAWAQSPHDGQTPAAPEVIGAWRLPELEEAPTMRWLSRRDPIHSLLYTGEKFRGRQTEVFAFYASPATLSRQKLPAGKRFPAVVLIHGGGGTAFAEWVWLWARRGYAAIAMDLAGSRPPAPKYDAQGRLAPNQAAGRDSRQRLEHGGPFHGREEKFESIGGDVSDDWPYHAVANVILAHSLLRSFPEVDPGRTAVTGISWGGYTTCLAASVDRRFQAAVPVYGCGFLFEGESVQKPAIDRLADRRDAWIQAYDPSRLLPHCRVPMLFVNGANDIHYPLDSYQKSFDVTGGSKQMRIEVNMRHGHQPGWAPQEIGWFIDSYCQDGPPLPRPGPWRREGKRLRLECESETALRSAALHYTTDEGLRSKRRWQSQPGQAAGTVVHVPAPPQNANTWFISVTDERGAMVTTPVQFQP